MKMLTLFCILAVSNLASAELIRGIDIDFVTIGNAGNVGDTRTEANPSGCGAVSYYYQIGKYEITNGQWDTFVSTVGAPTGSEPAEYPGAQHPRNIVSWYETLQFCNYLTTGDKSQGAYLFSGNNNDVGDFLGIDRDSAVSAYGTAYVIPTEDEWYKAAYYTGSGYSTYANGTDTPPTTSDTCYNQSPPHLDGPWDVGMGTEEQNGTFDMMGNVSEWNESLLMAGSDNRVFRGGAFNSIIGDLASSKSNYHHPGMLGDSIGFRVASIPEPTTIALFALGGLMLRKRNRF